jgi:LacI family transcriptional regulator
MARRVTLTDVSRAAGVGIATVSRAMGDHPDVSDATRDRIRAVAKELGYRPSAAARALRRGELRTISIIVPNFVWGWWEPVVHACIETASDAGYQVLVHPVAERHGGLAASIDTLTDVPTEGVVVISVPDQQSVREACDRIGIPGVAIDDSSIDIHFASISAANHPGAREVVDHLVSTGRSRIAFLGPTFAEGHDFWGDLLYLREREQGYRDALDAAGIPFDERRVIQTAFDETAPRCPELGALLDEDPEIDAVFCAFDQLAASALRELAARGLHVPEDIAVAGFDDERAAVLVTPQLTTARQPYAEMGRTAAELLLRALSGDAPEVARYEFPTQLIIRASTVPS